MSCPKAGITEFADGADDRYQGLQDRAALLGAWFAHVETPRAHAQLSERSTDQLRKGLLGFLAGAV